MALTVGLKRVRALAIQLSSIRRPQGEEAQEVFRQCCYVVMRSAIPADNQGDFVAYLGFDPSPPRKPLDQ